MNIFKRISALLMCLAIMFTSFGCGVIEIDKEPEDECEKNGHDWDKATCTEPKTCSVCEKTKGDPLGHKMSAADCLNPLTCSVCGAVEGEALGHTYSEDVTIEPQCNAEGESTFTCDICGDSYTEASVLRKYEASEIHELIKASICEIVTYDKDDEEIGLGSGFVYAEDGKIVTNYHVIDGAYSAKLTIDGTTYDVDYVLAYSVDKDIAVLKIDADGLTPLEVCTNDHTVGKAVYAMGSSRGITNTFSAGVITNDMREEDGVEYVQHDAAISNGNSGGPLVNEYCEVIGINTLTIKDSQNLNFAVSVRELDKLDFSKRMTVAKVYEAESDPFESFCEYIKTVGTYNSSYNYYEWDLGNEWQGDLLVNRYYQYDLDDDTIGINIAVTSDYTTIICEVVMDSADGDYEWNWFDTEFNTIYGYLYAGSFTGSSLGYYSESFDDYSTLSSALSLGALLVDLSLSELDSDLAIIGFEAEDFGFMYY